MIVRQGDAMLVEVGRIEEGDEPSDADLVWLGKSALSCSVAVLTILPITHSLIHPLRSDAMTMTNDEESSATPSTRTSTAMTFWPSPGRTPAASGSWITEDLD